MFKKVILVDHLSTFVDNNFYNYESLNFYSTWITSISFSLQFYYDFSSYSDIAIGSALLLNFNIPNNFNSPLRSTSIIDFWQRWHISLSNFINHYMYIPILKNLRNFNLYKNFFVILFIMTIIGLWHGPNYTYIIFGALHGIGLGVNHIFRSYNIKVNKILS